MLNQQKADIFRVSDKLVIACLSCTIWQIFSLFLTFCFYFICLKAREISRQNMENSKNMENIGHIVLGTVR